MNTEGDPGFEALLEHLRRCRGVDFSGFKRANLIRRVVNRLRLAGVGNCADYRSYLDRHPEEYAPLFDSLLINVTGFFRDESAWRYVGEEILPRLLTTTPAGQPIRVWSAGCASGQEVYTLAMLFAEAVGQDALCHRVKIYATDVDEEALSQARQATYDTENLEPVPAAFRQKYFETAGQRHLVRPDLRRAIIFGRHDVMRDAPIFHVDLLVCRNTLMYFTTEAQGRILTRFHVALVDAGYLFLGKAELILTHTHVFHSVNLKHHVFVKVAAVGFHPGLRRTPDLDTTGLVQDRVTHTIRQSWDVRATRSHGEDGTVMGAGLTFADITPPPRPQAEPVRIAPGTDGDAETLRAARAELETLNAALQITNAELETSNAEFESSNEELGSINQELHSTNAELETLNTELHQRTTELSATNAVLHSILAGLQIGLAVVDRSLTILLWNHEAERLWGLRADEVRGRSLLSPPLELPAHQLPVAAFLAGVASREEWTVNATNHRGRAIQCHITFTPLLGPGGERAGAVLLMEEAEQ